MAALRDGRCAPGQTLVLGLAATFGEFVGDLRTQTFAQLLIDFEESPHARAVVLGEL